MKLIAATLVDWVNYVKTAEQLIGRSPTRSLDKNNDVVGTLESFAYSLSNFIKNNGRFDNRTLQHIQLTFLCELSREKFFNLMCTQSQLVISICEDCSSEDKVVFILSANILILKNLIISNLLNQQNLFFSDILEILEKLYFQKIFSEYRKVIKTNGSIILEKRK